MYLSDNELLKAIENGSLIVKPIPTKIDPSGIDLHLDKIEQAKVWDIHKYSQETLIHGNEDLELRIGKFKYKEFAPKYLIPPPEDSNKMVFRRGNQVIVKQGGFLLWQTKEEVGTPEQGAKYIAFIDGKSTRARAGLIVHLTAPTIHATWSGHVTLEIANLGPFNLVLQEDDSIAQIVVATISSPPSETMKNGVTYGQVQVTGQAQPATAAK
jgi:dCTP deaminase